MVATRLAEFGGMVPLMSRRLLPDNMAEFAANVDLESGEIRPIQLPTLIHDFDDPDLHRAVRLPNPDNDDLPYWVGFRSRFSRFYPSPLVNDAYRRFIWIDDNGPGEASRLVQNSFARIAAGNTGGNAPRPLGVPQPTLTPTLAVEAAGTSDIEDRGYLITYVNDIGEEGQPSPVATIATQTDSTVRLTGLGFISGEDPADTGVVTTRIYRSISSAGGTAFYRVADIPVATTEYLDNRPVLDVARDGLILPSVSWRVPEDMEGFIPLPGGFFAGWRGRDVFFSEPYRPWAWPAEYVVSVSHDIVGCGTVGSTLVVLTESKPVLITGFRPDAMSIEKQDSIEPCVSPNAVVTTPEGMYFAGRGGLLFIGAGTVTNLTRDLIGQKKWRDEYLPRNLSLVKLNDTQIMAFSTDGNGFILDLSSSRAALTGLYNFVPIESAWTDQWTGEIHLMADSKVYEWGRQLAPYSVGRWHSKEFQLPKPVNFGAFRISLDTTYPPETPAIPSVIIQPFDQVEGGPWTDLAAIPNYCRPGTIMFNESLEPGTYPPGKGPGDYVGLWPYWYGVVGTNIVTPINLNLPPGIPAYVGIYAKGDLVWENYVENDITYRIPSGFKSEIWQVVILTRVPVMKFQMAETGKELANV